FKWKIREDAGVGLKPMSPFGTKRLVRKAIRFAIDHGRRSVTLVHKGNIMKYTEGAFAQWGYEVAREEFAAETIPWADVEKHHRGVVPPGKILIQDYIADVTFQHVLTRPRSFDVIARGNLNGDCLSDATASQAGCMGKAPARRAEASLPRPSSTICKADRSVEWSQGNVLEGCRVGRTRAKVTIVGAGNVGHSAAQWMLSHRLADVVLVDVIEGMPQGK